MNDSNSIIMLPIFLLSLLLNSVIANSGLQINCETNEFELNGQPFRYIAGEIHYFRIPKPLWEDRLKKMRVLGLNAAQIYVAWNFHEEKEGEFNFSDDRNLREFIQLCKENDLHVLLRVGPYICAEWEHGGHPAWLLAYDDLVWRDNKGPLGEEVLDLQYPNGPILSIGIDNEYGNYGKNSAYMDELAGIFKEFGYKSLYTTDSAGGVAYGKANGAYPTVDFGVSNRDKVRSYFKAQRNQAKCGPYVNSEFYPGWFDKWYMKRTNLPSVKSTLDTIKTMYSLNASFSFYMIHGGSNFGFWAGAHPDQAMVQSYDYGAPITEAGQLTEAALALREFVKTIPNWPNPPLEVPQNHTSFKFTNITAKRIKFTLTELFLQLTQHCAKVEEPQNFEKFNQSYGYAIYSHEFEGETPKEIEIEKLRDLAYVFIGNDYQGVLGNCSLNKKCKTSKLNLNSESKGVLHVIVEELGRLNYFHGYDRKGILSSVKADGKVLKKWRQCGVNHDKIHEHVVQLHSQQGHALFSDPTDLHERPGVYFSQFQLQHHHALSDIGLHTFFDPIKFGKGQLFLNGFNVGRYWPLAGPQRTVYVPGNLFDFSGVYANNLVLINFEPRGALNTFDFVKEHIWE